jgi:hypothetical protein
MSTTILTDYTKLQNVQSSDYDMVMVIDPANTPSHHLHSGSQAMYEWNRTTAKWENIPATTRYVSRYPTESQIKESLGADNFQRIIDGDYELARKMDSESRGYPVDDKGWDITKPGDITPLKWVDRRSLDPDEWGHLG